jgi:hypothetical protein
MLDSDLAEIYGVPTKRLNEQIQRNIGRFPPDFMFRLTAEEASSMRSQNATASKRNIRYLPYAFTEHGTIMLASVLNSPIAVQASVQVVRAFVRLREMLLARHDLARRLDALEKKYDGQFRTVFDAIRQLMPPSKQRPRQIGFKPS